MNLLDNFRADGNVASFDDAMEKLSDLWKKVHPDCPFLEEMPTAEPPERLDLPRIVYSLVRRQHASGYNDSNKPRPMNTYPDPDQPGHNLTEVVEWFDCLTSFAVFGNSKREAREWTEKFENFVLTYIGHFKKLGVTDIIFREELSPGVSSEFRQDLPHRHLRYSVKIQRTQIIRNIRLDEIGVSAETNGQQSTEEPIATSNGNLSNPSNEFLRLAQRTNFTK